MDECAASPCQNSGACKETGSSYTCTCQVHSSNIHILHSQLLVYCEQAGYEGKNCEVNTNDCARSPCAAGGTCTDLVAGFSCSCPPGTTGDTCAEQIGRYLRENFNIKRYYEISDILDTGCKPISEKLMHTTISYIWLCVAADECASGPCSLAGTLQCEDGENSYYCDCRAGYSGSNCEININECEGDPCRQKELVTFYGL